MAQYEGTVLEKVLPLTCCFIRVLNFPFDISVFHDEKTEPRSWTATDKVFDCLTRCDVRDNCILITFTRILSKTSKGRSLICKIQTKNIKMIYGRDAQLAAHGPDPASQRVLSDPRSRLKNTRNVSWMNFMNEYKLHWTVNNFAT